MAEKIWKTLKLGTYKDANALSKALQKAECRVGYWADDILDKVELAEKSEVDLIIRSVAELNLNSEIYALNEIYARAKELGLELCPAEVGPQLRLQYPEQPDGEALVIAMIPITDRGGVLHVFCVNCGPDLWLRAYYGDPTSSYWDRDSQFVFVCPATASS